MVLDFERCASSPVKDLGGSWNLDDDLETCSQPSPTNSTTSPKLIGVGMADEAALAGLVDSEVLKSMAADPWMGGDDTCARLLPLKTPSDHNCLCHAMALALWGRQDKDCVLREGIARSMEADTEEARYFKEQWMHTMLERDTLAFGMEIHRSSEEWVREWREELELAKDLNCSLTEIHVFALAHIVRRPIIIYSPRFCKDVNGTAFAPIYFAGVYLPVLLSPEQCSARSPVLLTYSQSHFSPLIPCPAGNREPLAPLVDAEGQYLPVQFVDQTLFTAGEAGWQGLLQKYMTVEHPEGQPYFAVQLSMDQQFFLDGLPAPQCERFFTGRQSPLLSPLNSTRNQIILRVETEPPSPSSCQSSMEATLLEEPLSPDMKGRLFNVPKSSSGPLTPSLAQKRSFPLPTKLGGPTKGHSGVSKGSPMPQRSSPAQTLDNMRRCSSLRIFPSRTTSTAKAEAVTPPPAEEFHPAKTIPVPPLGPLSLLAVPVPSSPPMSQSPPGRLSSRPKVGIVRRPPGETPLSPPPPYSISPTRPQSPTSPTVVGSKLRPGSPTLAGGMRHASPFPQRATSSASAAGSSSAGSPMGSPTVLSPTFASAKVAGQGFLAPAAARPRPASPFPDAAAGPPRRPATPVCNVRPTSMQGPERCRTSPGRKPRPLSPDQADGDAPPVQNLSQQSPKHDRPVHVDMPIPQNPNAADVGDLSLKASLQTLEKRASGFIRADSGLGRPRKASPLPLQPPALSPRQSTVTPSRTRMP